MAFSSPDPACLRKYGEDFLHNGTVTVKLIRVEQEIDAAIGDDTELVLFGTIKDSGFQAQPKKGDAFEQDDSEWEVTKVKRDWAGGSPDTAGLHITVRTVA